MHTFFGLLLAGVPLTGVLGGARVPSCGCGAGDGERGAGRRLLLLFECEPCSLVSLCSFGGILDGGEDLVER